jgi:hypothetical protein
MTGAGGPHWVVKKYFLGAFVQERLGNAALDLKVKVKFTLEQTTKAHLGSKGIAQLFL